MNAKEVVETWVERFNAGDAAALAELYHEDAINHQVTQEPVKGREAIRTMFEREFGAAKMVCIAEAIHDAGDVAALEWRDPLAFVAAAFHRPRRPDRLAARLLGQAVLPEDARTTHGVADRPLSTHCRHPNRGPADALPNVRNGGKRTSQGETARTNPN